MTPGPGEPGEDGPGAGRGDRPPVGPARARPTTRLARHPGGPEFLLDPDEAVRRSQERLALIAGHAQDPTMAPDAVRRALEEECRHKQAQLVAEQALLAVAPPEARPAIALRAASLEKGLARLAAMLQALG